MEVSHVRIRKRNPKMTAPQKKYLMDYMANHRYLATNKLIGSQGKDDREREWKALANELNKLQGPQKRVREWKKTWNDIKCSLKRYGSRNTNVKGKAKNSSGLPNVTSHLLPVIVEESPFGMPAYGSTVGNAVNEVILEDLNEENKLMRMSERDSVEVKEEITGIIEESANIDKTDEKVPKRHSYKVSTISHPQKQSFCKKRDKRSSQLETVTAASKEEGGYEFMVLRAINESLCQQRLRNPRDMREKRNWYSLLNLGL